MQVSFTIPWLTRKRLLGIALPLVVIPVIIMVVNLATARARCCGRKVDGTQALLPVLQRRRPTRPDR